MNRFYVPPIPEVPPKAPEADAFLEKFREDTIKGKKIPIEPRRRSSADCGADMLIDDIPGAELADNSTDWGIGDIDAL